MKLPAEERKQIENEMLFRRFNEKVGSDLNEVDALHISDGNPQLVLGDDVLLQFKCECSDENCNARIPLQLSIYQNIHLDRGAFIIKLNHQVNPIEKVLEKTATYSIVKKNNVTPEPRKNALLNDTDIDNSKV